MNKTALSLFIGTLFAAHALANADAPAQYGVAPELLVPAKRRGTEYLPRVPNLPEEQHTWYAKPGETKPAEPRRATPVAEPTLRRAPIPAHLAAPIESPPGPSATQPTAVLAAVNVPTPEPAPAPVIPEPTLHPAPVPAHLAAPIEAPAIADATQPTAVLAATSAPTPQLAQAPAPALPPALQPVEAPKLVPEPASEPKPAVPVVPAAPRAVGPEPKRVATPRKPAAPERVVRPDAISPQIEAVPVAAAAPEPVAARPRIDLGPGLDNNAREALRQTRDFATRENLPVAGDDGRVVFTYGAGLPTIVCAPLRICSIDLQPGERVVGPLHAGDTVRWHVTPAESGAGRNVVTHIVVKPKDIGLDTNLMIPTDRRVYHLRLVSRAQDFVARVSFTYPEDTRAAWEAYQLRVADQQRSVVADLPPLSVDKLYFQYDIDGKERFRPIRVFDDGAKTYIQLPPEAGVREAPALVILSPNGTEQIVNYRVRNDYYIIDRLFDKAALIIGVGKAQEKVTLTRREPEGGRGMFGGLFTRSSESRSAAYGGGDAQ